MPPKEKKELLNLENFSVSQLPELQGKKEEIKSIIDANPIVKIVDTETYEAMKKSRTAVKTLRTGLEKEQTDVKRKIKEHVLDVVDKEYNSIVSDVKSEENLRQAEVTAWEDEVKKKKAEKERLEKERVDNIKIAIAFLLLCRTIRSRNFWNHLLLNELLRGDIQFQFYFLILEVKLIIVEIVSFLALTICIF